MAERGVYGTVRDIERMPVSELINYVNYLSDRAKWEKEETQRQQSLDSLRQQSRRKAGG